MTDNSKVFEEENKAALKGCQKLYLDEKTADVEFLFNNAESISAHKNILSVGSPVFDTMFYGSLPEKRHILISDAIKGAFREFLQFFYLSKVRLTAENIFQVANLCKKYVVIDGLSLCEAPMKKSLTINNMCSGYAMAKLLEIENIIKYCGEGIKENSSKILKSPEFLSCNHKQFDDILQLLSPGCKASAIVHGCMSWAKSECGRKNISSTSANLKVQLIGSFDRIPFSKLNSDRFSQFTNTYKQFFDEDELLAIILKIMPKKVKTVQSVCDFIRILKCFPLLILNK